MKEFWKQHPWRLEIVPGLLVIATALVPLMHWHQMAANTPALPGFTTDGAWLIRYVARVLFAFVLWIGGWQSNSLWVLSEREKRYDFWAIWTVVVMGVFGWFASGRMFGSFWLVITLLAVGVQSVIEALRPFALLQRPADAEPMEFKPGDRFYYREGTPLGRSLLLANVCILVLWLGFVRDWESLIIAFIVIFPSTVITLTPGMNRREIVISREKIAGRFGLYRLMIPMTHVLSCAVADPHPFTESFRGHRGWGRTWDGMEYYGDISSPMLRIDTTEGKTYLVGMKKPGTACALIQSVLSHHS